MKYFREVYHFETRTTLPRKRYDKEGTSYYSCFDIHGKVVACYPISVNVAAEGAPEKGTGTEGAHTQEKVMSQDINYDPS